MPCGQFSSAKRGSAHSLPLPSQQEDAKAAPSHASPLLGIGAGLSAATLSGFAGVYLELMFTSGATSLWASATLASPSPCLGLL